MGAQTYQVLFMILQETVVLAGFGIVVGLLVAAGLTRNVQSMLYGLKPTDPFTLRGTFLVMLRVATVGAGGRHEERLDLIQWLLFGTIVMDRRLIPHLLAALLICGIQLSRNGDLGLSDGISSDTTLSFVAKCVHWIESCRLVSGPNPEEQADRD